MSLNCNSKRMSSIEYEGLIKSEISFFPCGVEQAGIMTPSPALFTVLSLRVVTSSSSEKYVDILGDTLMTSHTLTHSVWPYLAYRAACMQSVYLFCHSLKGEDICVQ